MIFKSLDFWDKAFPMAGAIFNVFARQLLGSKNCYPEKVPANPFSKNDFWFRARGLQKSFFEKQVTTNFNTTKGR